SDQTVAIGYKPHYEGDISSKLHSLDLTKGEYKSVHDALINFILEEANKQSATKLDWNDLLVEDDPYLPILTIRTSDKHLLTALFNLKNVRYIEPLDYHPASPNKVMSTSGCSPSAEPLNSADYTTITPNAVLPWNFNNHNISQAWSLAQGSGITVGVIDAGLSSAQPLLGSQFNNGDSNVGRTVLAEYTYGTSAYTGCSHGNSMSAQAVGPRNNQGAATGVAYKSNLYFIRGCEDVVLDLSAERTAVKNACTRLGNNRNVKVISMSIGTPFSSSVLKDGVDYAYGKGKLIMAAAGTSLDFTTWYGVIYPAAYSSCVAVTGINDNGATCASCHDGSQVMYTIVMERAANSNRNSLALPPS
ncbi:MAG: S8 family serine peptidase, partial [Bacteroidota bacterium]